MRLDGFDLRIATTREDLEGAVRLVYHNYIEKGYCRLNPHGMHFYLHDVQPETRTLVAVRDGVVVSTATLVFDSPLGLPSDQLYRRENDALRAGGRRLAEISKLSSDRHCDKDALRALVQLFRLVYLLAFRLRGIDDLVILIEPHHEAFYRMSMGFARIGELKPDPAAKDAPSLLLRLDLAGVTEEGRRQHATRPGSSRRYNHFVLDPVLAGLTAELQAADTQLARLHARMAAITPAEPLDDSERGYLDLRLFALGFNCEKISKQAQAQDNHGHFREVLDLYERLLMVLPAHYEPDRRRRILNDATIAAWHCGYFARALTFIDMLEHEATSARQRVAALTLRATMRHSQGESDEAARIIDASLALPDLDADVRVNLCHTAARVAIDTRRYAEARRHVAAGMAALPGIAAETARIQLNGLLVHDRYYLERRCGDLDAAEAALAGMRPRLDQLPPAHRLMHLGGTGMLELQRGRPREALRHGRAALACCDAESSPFNASVITGILASAALQLGDLTPAQAYAERSLALATRVGHAGLMLEAGHKLVEAHLLAGQGEQAQAVLARVAPQPTGAQKPESSELRAIQFLLARGARNWPAAAQLMDEVLTQPDATLPDQAMTLMARTEIELCAGRITAAAGMAQRLPAPDTLPGCMLYRCRWQVVRAILAATGGDAAGAAALLQEPFAHLRQHDAILCLAEAGNLMLETAQISSCEPLRQDALAILRETVQAAALPFFAARLERALNDA